MNSPTEKDLLSINLDLLKNMRKKLLTSFLNKDPDIYFIKNNNHINDELVHLYYEKFVLKWLNYHLLRTDFVYNQTKINSPNLPVKESTLITISKLLHKWNNDKTRKYSKFFKEIIDFKIKYIESNTKNVTISKEAYSTLLQEYESDKVLYEKLIESVIRRIHNFE